MSDAFSDIARGRYYAGEPSAIPSDPCIENGCTDVEDCDEICIHSRLLSQGPDLPFSKRPVEPDISIIYNGLHTFVECLDKPIADCWCPAHSHGDRFLFRCDEFRAKGKCPEGYA